MSEKISLDSSEIKTYFSNVIMYFRNLFENRAS